MEPRNQLEASLARQGIYPRNAAPCVHLGKPTGGTVKCKACGGSERLELYACAVHEVCTTTGKTVPGFHRCRCESYKTGG